MASEHVERPSPILRYFEDALGPLLPEDHYRRMAAHDAAVAETTSRHDLRRALRCAEWAVELAGGGEKLAGDSEKPGGAREGVAVEHQHPGRRLAQVLRQAWDASEAAEFAVLASIPGVGGTNLELVRWIDDVVEVARRVAAKDGWDAVPWEELLVELLSYEPSEAG